MHLDRVTIHRFRGLQDLTLDGLGRINLFVGPNDTGKTSVLEALTLYCDPLNPRHWLATAARRDLERGHLPTEALRWIFPQSSAHPSGPLRISIAAQGSYPTQECSASLTLLEQQRASGTPPIVTAGLGSLLGAVTAPNRDEQTERALLGGLLGLIVAAASNGAAHSGPRRGAQLELSARITDQAPQTVSHQLWNDQPLIGPPSPPPPLAVQLLLPFSHRMERLPVEQLSQATLAGFDQEVLRVMQMVDPHIQRIEILAPPGEVAAVWLHHQEAGVAPLSSFGDGVRRSLFYALALPLARGGLLLVDELETAIHISAIGEVFRWLVQACKEHDVQLFATTHSQEAIDAVLEACRPAHLADVVTYQLRGVAPTRAERFSGQDLESLRYEMGLDVRGGAAHR